MKKISLISAVIFQILLNTASATPAQVIIIRHGERPVQGNVFDRAWVIQFQENSVPTFYDIPEKILPTDSN